MRVPGEATQKYPPCQINSSPPLPPIFDPNIPNICHPEVSTLPEQFITSFSSSSSQIPSSHQHTSKIVFYHCVQTVRLELLRSNYRGGCLLSHVQQTLRITLNTVKALRSKLLSWPFGMGISAESSIKALKVSRGLLSGGS